jgi:hypothetical protein
MVSKKYFYYSEKSLEMSKGHGVLYNRINGIQNRRNILLTNDDHFNLRHVNLKNRSELIKTIQVEKIKRENESLVKRLANK